MIVSLHNPVIPTQIFAQSRNTNAYFWHPISRVYFGSRILFFIFFQNPEVQLQHYCPDVTGNFHFRFINDNVITFFPVYVCCSCCACCFCRMHVCLGDTTYFVAYCFSFVQKLLKTQNSYTEFYLSPGGNNFGSLLITVLRLLRFLSVFNQ